MNTSSIYKFLAISGVLFWLLLMVAMFGRACGQSVNLHLPKQGIWIKEKTGRYEIANPSKFIGWGVLAIAGAVDGMVEGYEFDGRKSFERKFEVSPNSFWGSQSWRRAYVGGDPQNGYKSKKAQIFGANDFYHVADDVRKLGYITGGITVAIGGKQTNSKWWHYAADFAIGFAISGLAKQQAMEWVRH